MVRTSSKNGRVMVMFYLVSSLQGNVHAVALLEDTKITSRQRWKPLYLSLKRLKHTNKTVPTPDVPSPSKRKTWKLTRRGKEFKEQKSKTQQNRPRPPLTLLRSQCHRLFHVRILLYRNHRKGSHRKRSNWILWYGIKPVTTSNNAFYL